MTQPSFYINGQVISFVSLLIMIAFILFSLRKRRLAGFTLSNWVVYIYAFLALDALVAASLTGFQLNDTNFFYATRRVFSLFSILFIFLTIFDFPEKHPPPAFARQRRWVIAFMGGQMALNAFYLVQILFFPASVTRFLWLEVFSNLLVPLSFLWIALLARHKQRSVLAAGKEEAAAALGRFSWFFWLGAALATVVFLREWFPSAARVHTTASSYGWMIVCAGTALIFLGFNREKRMWVSHITMLILLALLLGLGLMAEIFSANLKGLVLAADVDRLMRPFLLVQVGIALLAFLALPRWLGHLFPERTAAPAEKTKALSARQRDVMRLLAADKSNAQIAAELNITVQTVKYHVSKLMREQDRRNRRELGRLARKMLKDDIL